MVVELTSFSFSLSLSLSLSVCVCVCVCVCVIYTAVAHRMWEILSNRTKETDQFKQSLCTAMQQ